MKYYIQCYGVLRSWVTSAVQNNSIIVDMLDCLCIIPNA